MKMADPAPMHTQHGQRIRELLIIGRDHPAIAEPAKVLRREKAEAGGISQHPGALTALSGSGPAYFFYLVEAMTDAGLQDYLRWSDKDAQLHTKGVLTGRVLVDGSMNLTESGVALNDEAVTVSFEPEQVATARIHFELYGQP